MIQPGGKWILSAVNNVKSVPRVRGDGPNLVIDSRVYYPQDTNVEIDASQ